MENIYVLEDDDNIRKLVCYALAKEGYLSLIHISEPTRP